jgi:hypothetical protein
MDGWKRNIHIYMMELYPAIKKNEIICWEINGAVDYHIK